MGEMCPIPVALRQPVSRLALALKGSQRTQWASHDPGAQEATDFLRASSYVCGVSSAAAR